MDQNNNILKAQLQRKCQKIFDFVKYKATVCTKPRCIAEGIALGIALSIVHSPKIFQ